MANFFEELANADDEQIGSTPPPSEKVVDWFHSRASISRPEDIHHRQGFQPENAPFGNHDHDGTNSKGLFDATTVLTDITATATGTQIADAVNAINAALRLKGAG